MDPNALLERTLHNVVKMFVAGRLQWRPRIKREFSGLALRRAVNLLRLYREGGDHYGPGVIEDAMADWRRNHMGERGDVPTVRDGQSDQGGNSKTQNVVPAGRQRRPQARDQQYGSTVHIRPGRGATQGGVS